MPSWEDLRSEAVKQIADGNPAAALALMVQAIDARTADVASLEAAGGAPLAEALSSLAVLHHQAGDSGVGAPLLQRAIGIWVESGADGTVVAEQSYHLGTMWLACGRVEDAAQVLEHAATLTKPGKRALAAWQKLGFALHRLGRPLDASKALEQAVQAAAAALGPRHDETLHTMRQYAALLQRARRHREAVDVRAEVLEYSETRGRLDEQLARDVEALALAHAHLKEPDPVKHLLTRSLSVRHAAFGGDVRGLADGYFARGRCLEALGDFSSAQTHFAWGIAFAHGLDRPKYTSLDHAAESLLTAATEEEAREALVALAWLAGWSNDAEARNAAIDRLIGVTGARQGVALEALHALLSRGVPEGAWPKLAEAARKAMSQALAFHEFVATYGDPEPPGARAAARKARPEAAAADDLVGPSVEALIEAITRDAVALPDAIDDIELMAAARALSPFHPAARRLVGLLDVPQDEELVVLHPKLRKGYRVRLSGVVDNRQLHVLLAAALHGDSTSGWLPAPQPEPNVIDVYTGTGEQRIDGSDAGPTWTLFSWAGLSAEGTLPGLTAVIDKSGAPLRHRLPNDGLFAEIPEFADGVRVVLLGRPTSSETWPVERAYDALRASVDVTEVMDRSTFAAWIERIVAARSTKAFASVDAAAWRLAARELPPEDAAVALQTAAVRLEPDGEGLSEALEAVADVLAGLQRFDQAAAMRRRHLQLAEASEDPDAIAHACTELARVARKAGADDVDDLLKRAVTIRTEHPGPDSRDLAVALQALAVARGSSGRLHEAISLQKRVVGLRAEAKDPLEHGRALTALGRLQGAVEGQLEAALESLRQAEGIKERALGTGHPQLAHHLDQMARYYDAAGKPDDAAVCRARADRIRAALEASDGA